MLGRRKSEPAVKVPPSGQRKWHHYNATPPNAKTGPSVEHAHHGEFKIIAPPNTDIWRRTDEDDVFNAPFVYQMIGGWEFKRATVTVEASWKTQYDQGGLVLIFPDKYGELKEAKSIKAGVEFYDGHPHIAVVGTDDYSDWSLASMDTRHPAKVTFCFERRDNSLWVYARQEGTEKLVPVRESKWAFAQHRLHEQIWIGVYAAKPKPDVDDPGSGLSVLFTGLRVEEVEPQV